MDHQCFRGNLIAGTSLHPLERHCEKTVINFYFFNGCSMFSWQSQSRKEDCFVPRNDEHRVTSNSLIRLLRTSQWRTWRGF